MINPTTGFEFRFPDGPFASGNFAVGFCASQSSPFFDGHLPGEPVLPAVAMVDTCLHVIRSAFPGNDLAIVKINSAKFLAKIGPEQKVQIRMVSKGSRTWGFEWTSIDSQAKLAQIEFSIDKDLI